MIGSGCMNNRGVMRQSAWTKGICPFCYKDLGKIELIKRKTKKKCTCKNCGKLIDERNIVW